MTVNANKQMNFLPSSDVAPKALFTCVLSFLFALAIGIIGAISSHFEFQTLTILFFALAVLAIAVFMCSFAYYLIWMAIRVYKNLKKRGHI